MMQCGNVETAMAEIPKIMQSYPGTSGIKILQIHDGNFKNIGWTLQYCIAKKESGHIAKWWDW